jgi:hypothetical protein
VSDGYVDTLSNLLPHGPVTVNQARKPLRSAPCSVGDLYQVIAKKEQVD